MTTKPTQSPKPGSEGLMIVTHGAGVVSLVSSVTRGSPAKIYWVGQSSEIVSALSYHEKIKTDRDALLAAAKLAVSLLEGVNGPTIFALFAAIAQAEKEA